jgi:hypothetical protein
MRYTSEMRYVKYIQNSLENVGALTSHKPMGLHVLLRDSLYMPSPEQYHALFMQELISHLL